MTFSVCEFVLDFFSFLRLIELKLAWWKHVEFVNSKCRYIAFWKYQITYEVSCLSFSIYGKKHIIQILFPTGILKWCEFLSIFVLFLFLCVNVPATFRFFF